MNRKNVLWVVLGSIALIVFVIAFIRVEMLRSHAEHIHADADEHAAEARHVAVARGPHGGRLFYIGGFAFEVSIHETGVEPRFRVYLFKDDQPVPVNAVKLSAILKRLGTQQQIRFVPEADYLLSAEVVYEPHSFAATFTAVVQKELLHFGYSQIEGRVSLPRAALQSSGITLEAAGPQRIVQVLRLPGEVQIRDDNRFEIVPRVAGIAAEVRKLPGDVVRKDEVLLVVESQELAAMMSMFLSAQQRLELSSSRHARELKLWQQRLLAEQVFLVTQKELAEAEIASRTARESLLALGIDAGMLQHPERLANRALTRFEVRSPVAGVVLARHVSRGEAVSRDTAVFTVGNVHAMQAQVSIFASDVGRIKPGQKVQIAEVNGLETVAGVVQSISSVVSAESRAAMAHVYFSNPQGRWRAGQFVEAMIEIETVQVPVAVRRAALQTFRDWTVVFAQYAEQFEVRPLTLGRGDEAFVEVVNGIAAGQPYAVQNAFVLKAELSKADATHDH